VHNGACSHLFPLMIAVPENTEDVSQIILTARYRRDMGPMFLFLK
jgi:hypothetical protein